MSTTQQPEPEERSLPPGVDPTRQVMHPPRTAASRPSYQPIGGHAAAATAVFALLLVLDIVAVGSSLLEVQLLDRLADGENVPDSELDANDTRQGMIGLGQGTLFFACAITFLLWLHRAYENLDALVPGHRRYGVGWSIGAWFVPILNLWRPKQIVNDVWHGGLPAGRRAPFWLMLWWIAWLITNVLGRIAFPELSADATLEELRTDAVNYIVADSFDVVAVALAILVIRVLTKRHEARAAAVGADGPPAAGAPASETAAPQPGAQPEPATPEPGPRQG